MIKLKEIPIGELTKELMTKEFVYVRHNNEPLKKVTTKTVIELSQIELVKFYIEDTSEGVSELTYKDIYEEFLRQHEPIQTLVSDYRPSINPNSIVLWLKETSITFEVIYHPDTRRFEWRPLI